MSLYRPNKKELQLILAIVLISIALTGFAAILHHMHYMACLYKRRDDSVARNKSKRGSKHIPKIIHQTFKDKNNIHPTMLSHIEDIKNMNPGWEYRLYDDKDIVEFIRDNYEPHVLACYNKINPVYGAARADFFRYLLMYKYGGVYLDSKSGTEIPLDHALHEDDELVLSHWRAREWHKEIGNKLGEFQQWYIICKPSHPLMKTVIDNVMDKIANFDLASNKTGPHTIFTTTGPIIYTKSLLPDLHKYKHRVVDDGRELGLIYDQTGSLYGRTRYLGSPHYSDLAEPLILS